MAKAQYAGAWPKVRLVILERDGYRCQIRGPHCTGHANTVDHIVEVVHGGRRLDPTNLRAACATCNAERGGRTRRYKPPTEAGPSRAW